MRQKLRLIVCIFLLFTIVPVVAFYARFELVSNHLKNDLGYKGSAANAVKHAYAAAELYQFINYFAPDSKAEKIVLWFGTANEYAERVVKFQKPDSYAEILKDFHNNLAGITTAQWQASHPDNQDTLDILLKMANNNGLIVVRDNNPFHDATKVPTDNLVGEASQWLFANKAAVQTHVQSRLNQLYIAR